MDNFKLLEEIEIKKNDLEIKLNEIEIKNKEIKLKDDKIKFYEDKFLKKQKRIVYPNNNVIYMLTTEDNLKKRIYIIGKAENLTYRLSTYNKTCEHQVVYYKSCGSIENMELIEKIVIKKLDIYKEKANRDRFILPINKNIDFFKKIIDESIKIFENEDTLNDEKIDIENNIGESETEIIYDNVFIENSDNIIIKKRGRPPKNSKPTNEDLIKFFYNIRDDVKNNFIKIQETSNKTIENTKTNIITDLNNHIPIIKRNRGRPKLLK